MKIVTVAASFIVVLLMMAGASEAARNPSKPEQRGIAQALAREGFDCSAIAGSCRRRIKVSTKDQEWAAGYISGSQVQATSASLHRKHHKWHVHQIGNGGGCGVPDDVQDDLKLACY